METRRQRCGGLDVGDCGDGMGTFGRYAELVVYIL